MKRFMKSSERGVTLLEIMLVLAIAAMVIVMSIRYYQSATNSQQVNFTVGQVQSIYAAADNLAVSGGSYAGVVTTENIKGIVGERNMKTVTGGDITIPTGTTASIYQITIPLNATLCPAVAAQLSGNPKVVAECKTTTVTVSYDNTKG